MYHFLAKFSFVTTLLFLITIAAFGQIKIQTEVNASRIGLNDQLVLTYTFTAPGRSVEIDDPKAPGFVYQGHNNFAVNNQYVIKYIYAPTQIGNHKIQGLKITDSRGQTYHAETVNVEVVKGSVVKPQEEDDAIDDWMRQQEERIKALRDMFFGDSDPQPQRQNSQLGELEDHFFIIPETEKTSYYLGEAIHVKYKLYNNTGFSNYQITGLPNHRNFIARNIKRGSSLPSDIETYNNTPYRSFVLKEVVLFGTETGTFPVGDINFSAIVEYFGMADITSSPKNITIKPLPAPPSNTTFLGGVGDFSMSCQYSRENSSVDDPIMLSITITGNGNLEKTSPPDIVWPTGVNVSDPQVDIRESEQNPLMTSKTYTYALYAAEDTSLTIPQIEWTYFDPRAGQYKTLSAPEQVLTFFPGSGNNTGQDNGATISEPGDKSSGKGWLWPVIITLITIFSTLFLIIKSRKQKNKSTPLDMAPEALTHDQPGLTDTGNEEITIQQYDQEVTVRPAAAIPSGFPSFNIEQLHVEVRSMEDKAYYRSIGERITAYFAQNGLDTTTPESLYSDLRAHGTSTPLIEALKSIYTAINTHLYAPLESNLAERAALFDQVQTFFKNLQAGAGTKE